jgi:hypothetical protein
MTNKLKLAVFLALALGPLAGIAPAQEQKVFNWQPANDETARLDPANYHAGRTYHPDMNGGNIHVDIRAQMPVTVFLANAEAWNEALQHPEAEPHFQQLCMREHVVELTYVCELPPAAMTLVIRDDRSSPDGGAFAKLGAVLSVNGRAENTIQFGLSTLLNAQGSTARKFQAPNDVHIQYYSWNCIENCVQPEFEWIRTIKEKYELSGFLKVYGGFAPDHDKSLVSIRINSPAPMIVAMLPSDVADRLYANPQTLVLALQNHSCQQRGVQKLEFQCSFNLADGPQSLIVAPEETAKVPHKKAEVEMQAVKCVANCQMIEVSGKSEASAAGAQ